jgi:hypothetical protein
VRLGNLPTVCPAAFRLPKPKPGSRYGGTSNALPVIAPTSPTAQKLLMWAGHFTLNENNDYIFFIYYQ